MVKDPAEFWGDAITEGDMVGVHWLHSGTVETNVLRKDLPTVVPVVNYGLVVKLDSISVTICPEMDLRARQSFRNAVAIPLGRITKLTILEVRETIGGETK